MLILMLIILLLLGLIIVVVVVIWLIIIVNIIAIPCHPLINYIERVQYRHWIVINIVFANVITIVTVDTIISPLPKYFSSLFLLLLPLFLLLLFNLLLINHPYLL